ncbi:MAG: ATP-dependent sacrificial sulfur transferase LarE [Pirellulales bacterium]|nr:ATP-dependent sacrificial sulfur transferase LarE [Pirellulales bacterium]
MSNLNDELQTKVDNLLVLLKSYGSAAVAYSGGLDSAMLAKAAQLALGDKAVAITATSASLAAGELDEATDVAVQIGIEHRIVQTNEFENPDYLANAPDRCYHCKFELFREVGRLAEQLGLAVVIDGSNSDDGQEHRPGTRAARELKVLSPLAECGFVKDEIREVAAHWGIAIHDKPATPCLSSRIAYGQAITIERLEMIDAGERFLREHDLQPLRVRYHEGDVARIEVPLEALPKFVEPRFRKTVVDKLKAAGFKYISLDLEGFRSGSLNKILPADVLELAKRSK